MTFEELKQVSNVSERNRKHFDNLILVIRCGSWLFGLNNENSDEDFIGVFINPIDEYFSMHQRVDLVDFSVVDKLENGKNSKDAVDFKAYSLPKFMSLLKSNNPTIFELLFASKENIVFSNEFGNMLIENRDLFLSSNAVNSFFGYAEQQKKKFFTKKETYFSLTEAKDYLLKQDEKTYLTELIANDKTEFFKVFSDKGFDLVYVADIRLNKNQTVKRAIGLLDTRIGECSSRVDLIKEKGFDCYSIDTQFLTDSGWKYYNDIISLDKLATINDNINIEYQHYTDRVEKEINDYIYEYSNNYTNFCVTEGHRLLVSDCHRSKKNGFSTKYNDLESNWHYKTVKDINDGRKSTFHVRNNIINNNEDYSISDELLIAIGLFVSEGNIVFRDEKIKCVSLSQTNKGKELFFDLINKIKELYNFKTYEHKRDTRNTIEFSFVSHDKDLCNFLYEECGTGSKHVRLPSFIHKLSKRQCSLLIEALWSGDGSVHGRFNHVYHTSSSQLADDFQLLCMYAQRDVNYYDYSGRYDNTYVKKEDTARFEINYSKEDGVPKVIKINHEIKKHAENYTTGGLKTHYSGKVVCFSVENENLITRRKGKIAIQGNCKHTSHYLRLMAEFLQLANNNTISFPLNDEIVAKTKRGEFEIAEVHKHMQDYYDRAKEVTHKLEPLKSKTTEINELTIEITRRFFGLATEE